MRATRGFTLVEIVVVMLIFAVVVAMGSVLTRAIMAGQKRTVTTTRMAAVDAALAQYAAVQKRLPCPANGQKNSNTATDAGKQIDAADPTKGCLLPEQRYGVVPWRDLGLTEDDASDGWGRRLTYRVYPVLSATNGMDMSACDPAAAYPSPPAPSLSNSCTGASPCCATCTSSSLSACNSPLLLLIERKGLEVQNVAGTKVMDPAPAVPPPTGAAYVVISPGETGGGGYLPSGQLFASTTNGKDGAREQLNYADLDPPIGIFIDDAVNDDTTGTAHFDDMVSRPSVSAVINKAGLGPRAH